MEEIILWESDAERIRACVEATVEAMKELGIKGRVTVNSEPPLISRNAMCDRLPALEIQGMRCSLYPGRPFTKDQLVRLFWKVFKAGESAGTEGEIATCNLQAT